jgi:hypothetical protein
MAAAAAFQISFRQSLSMHLLSGISGLAGCPLAPAMMGTLAYRTDRFSEIASLVPSSSSKPSSSRLMLFIVFMTSFTALVLVGASLYVSWKLTKRSRRGWTETDGTMSADTVSTLYPDRPIRPLPRRRLREKLSPEVADTIEYPPAPQGSTSLFYYPYDTKEEDYELKSNVLREIAQSASGDPASRQADRLAAERQFLARSAADRLVRQQQKGGTEGSSRHLGAYTDSNDSSGFDGYDSLENANNKKKRKIPSAGEASLNGLRSLSEESSHGHTSDPATDLPGDGTGPTSTPYYVPNTFGSSSGGISGSGRGRLGRLRNGRSPLRALSDGSSNWAGRNGKLRSPQWANETSRLLLQLPHHPFTCERDKQLTDMPSLQDKEVSTVG